MGGRIDCYLDIVSFYSYIGFVELLNSQEKLAAHGVEIEFHPVFLGGIMNESKNRPPWRVKAKANYLKFDSRRAAAQVDKPRIAFPKNFLEMVMTVLPLRALHYIKRNYPSAVLHDALHSLFDIFWTPPHVNLTNPDLLRQALLAAKTWDGSAAKLFSEQDVARIMDAAETAEMKEALKKATQEALGQGAFGAPWMWVTNGQGKSEPFFGSDRFSEIFKFLGVPHQCVAVLGPEQASRLSRL